MKPRHICMIFAIVTLLAACSQAPTASPTTPTTPPTTTPVPDPAYALVDTWTTTVTKEDILRVVPDFLQEFLCDNAGTFVWQFNADGSFTSDQTAPQEGCPKPEQASNDSTWSNEGNIVTLGKGNPDQMVYEWSVQGDLLTFKYKAGDCIPCKAIDTANPWRRLKK